MAAAFGFPPGAETGGAQAAEILNVLAVIDNGVEGRGRALLENGIAEGGGEAQNPLTLQRPANRATVQRVLFVYISAARAADRGRISMRVAISGAGIAGPSLAYWLQRSGHEVVLIEKAAQLRTGGYAVDFWGVGYTVAERMGILPEVREHGYTFREVRAVDARGRKVGGFSTDVLLQSMKGRFTSVPRGDLAAAIYRTVENRVETLFANSISAIDERATCVLVSFEHGAAREFDLVIGADGLHSTVRALVFGPERQFEKQLGYRVASFEVEGYRPRDELIGVTYTTPGRQVGRFALRCDRTMFSFLFSSERMTCPEPLDANERKAVLRQVFANAGWECSQILQAMDQISDVYYDRVSQIRMDGWSKGRVMLIGDAAACVSLLAGEGAGLAMTEAYVLAGELNRAGHDYQAAYRRYEQVLRPFVEGKQRSVRYFASAFLPKTRVGVWIRNQVTKLMAFPPLAHYFLVRRLRDDFDLPNYDVPVPYHGESNKQSV
jgi:2-polyprenyl-6-methoxyphenol hydroxylase-like FAD-dependent oxidoreductase